MTRLDARDGPGEPWPAGTVIVHQLEPCGERHGPRVAVIGLTVRGQEVEVEMPASEEDGPLAVEHSDERV